jgi:histidine triad (HIT) family protein
MKNCIFCDIVAAKVQSWIIYQNSEVICFLPKSLEAYGHTIVAPKAHYPDIYSVPESLLATIVVTAQMLSIQYRLRIGSTGLNLLHASGGAAQQSIFHFHVHIIPRFENDRLDAWPELSPGIYNKNEIWEKLKI